MYTVCRKLYFLLLLSLPLFASGCGGSAVTQYYLLNTVSPGVEKTAAAVSPEGENVDVVKDRSIQRVAIRQLEIPRYLDRPRIVSRDAENHLRIAESHQWGGRLRENIARTLSDDIAERLPSVDLRTAPFPGSMLADASLLIDIRQFELLADGRMHMKVRWHVQRTGKSSQSYFDHLISDNPIGERDYAGMAASMSSLLARLADKMASAIVNLPTQE